LKRALPRAGMPKLLGAATLWVLLKHEAGTVHINKNEQWRAAA